MHRSYYANLFKNYHYQKNFKLKFVMQTKISVSDPSECEILEYNGFLKNICRGGTDDLKFMCVNSNDYYTPDPADWSGELKGRISQYTFQKLCSNDPYFYQMCDKEFGGQINKFSEALCGHYLCKDKSGKVLTPVMMEKLGGKDICDFDCENTDLNRVGCEEEKIKLLSGALVRTREICNDVCDTYDANLTVHCEDEAVCNGYTYGLYCESEGKLTYVPPRNICREDKKATCDNEEDVSDCNVTATDNTDLTFCKHRVTEKKVPVLNNIRCTSLIESEKRYFAEYCIWEDVVLYQTNCSDQSRVGVTCEINGYNSTVSKFLICSDHTVSACDDKIDSACFETKTCKVHKHLMCDNMPDCAVDADEKHQVCRSTTATTCKRRVGNRGELPIPTSWIKDGVWDCKNGIDETWQWESCGKGRTFRYASNKANECENVFVCKTGNPGYVELQNLCDGLETCGNENEICSVSSRKYSISTSVLTTNKGLVKNLSYCQKGMTSLQQMKKSCVTKEFIYPDGDIFGGTATSLVLPNSKQSCDYMFGELYVYTSCTGRCLDTSCPLRNIPRYEVCPHQFKDRIGTIVNNEYLIFLTKSFGQIYTNRYFVCDDKIKCIDYSKVCDLVYDCNDGSDEVHCTNHFKCESSRRLLPKSKKCDGHIDCSDLSDECNEHCSKKILEGHFLKGLSWFIGISAVLTNLVTIGKSLRTLKSCKTATAVINRLMIILIAFGDFLIGCYLCAVAMYDTILLKQEYCSEQVTWVTSFKCSLIGVLSTLGSQISLFSMTGLSIIRTYGIWNSMRIPGEVTMIKLLQIATLIFSLISISAVISVVPIIATFENFFVNGVKFSDSLKIFVGTSDKATVFSVIQAYHGRTKNVELSWKTLTQMTREMFSHDFDYEDLTENFAKVDFYGNDGVCLFKYFVKNNDPQRWFVWSILSLNFICFFLISISYLLIGMLSRKSANSVASSKNNRQITDRNRRMNQRIAIIIFTDFVCWVPFIITCILHSVELIDATPWYSVFSMIILPLNSVINPFLYDSNLTDVIAAPLRFVSTRVSNSPVVQRIRQWLNLEQRPVDDIYLCQIETAVSDHIRRREGN